MSGGRRAGVKRDCVCPRANHQHGTVEAYTRDACRCVDCSTAQWAKMKWYRKQVAYGRWGPQWAHPCGVIRRLQALEAIGYTDRGLARRLGVDQAWVQRVANGDQKLEKIRTVTLRKIADLYDELASTPATDRWANGKRKAAKAKGWLPPSAWDDDTIDDPEAVSLEADPATLTYTQRLRLAVVLVEYGATQKQAAKRCRLADDTIRKMMKGEAA